MQAPLVIVGFLFGAFAWWQTRDLRWLLGAVVLVANWPYTLFVIMPINNQIMTINSAGAGPTSRALVEKWGRLHAARTLLGPVATLILFWASVK